MRYAHCAEVRSAHSAEFVVRAAALHIVLLCAGGVERQVELVFPSEFEARLAHGVVAHVGTRQPFCQVGGVGSDYIEDSWKLDQVEYKLLGQDLMVTGLVRRENA